MRKKENLPFGGFDAKDQSRSCGFISGHGSTISSEIKLAREKLQHLWIEFWNVNSIFDPNSNDIFMEVK